MLLTVIKDILKTCGLNIKGNIIGFILEIVSENRNDINMTIGTKCRKNIIGINKLFEQITITNIISLNTHYEKIYSMNIIRIIGRILLQEMKRYKLKMTQWNHNINVMKGWYHTMKHHKNGIML